MSNLSFVIDSKFFKEISNRYDEMLIYKSNYIDFLLTQEEFKNGITNPEVGTTSSWLYLDRVKDFAKQRENFTINGYASYIAEGVNGENYNLGFGIVPSFLANPIESGKFVAANLLVLKFLKNSKITVNINNMESVFLGELGNDIQNINTVDYSKSVIELENFNELKSVIEKTKDTHNKEYHKHFNKMINSLNNKKVQGSKIENVNSEFSQTLGFSVKSFSYDDIVNLDLVDQEIEKIIIKGDDLRQLLLSVRRRSKWKNENLPLEFINWLEENTTIANNNKIYLAQNLKSGKHLNGLVEVQIVSREAELEKHILTYNKKVIAEKLFNQDNFYTLSYFSAFKNKDKSTYFKKSVQSNHVIEVKGSDGNKFITSNISNKSKTTYNFDIRTIIDSNFQNLVKGLKYRIDYTNINALQTDKIFRQNKKYENKTSSLDHFLKSFIVDNENGSLKVVIQNIVVLNKKDDYKTFTMFVNKKLIDPKYYHMFVPDVCLETLSGRALMKKNILNEEENRIFASAGPANGIVLGTKYTIQYEALLNDIYKNLQTTDKKSLRSLTPFYNTKWFYQAEFDYKKEIVRYGDYETVYPKFYNNILWSEGNTEVSKDGVQSFVGDPQIAVNGKLIGATGSDKGIKKNKGAPSDAKKEEKLKGKDEKVLKISDAASSLEFKRLNGSFDNAKSDGESLGEVYEQCRKRKQEIDSEDIIFSFTDLNGVDEDNPRGKDNANDFDSVEYVKKKRNLYEFRRCNIQPKLIKLINTAVEITRTQYPSLESAVIMSMASPPVDLSFYVYALHKQKKSVDDINNGLKEFEQYKNVKLDKKDVENIVSGFKKRGSDNNHANGLAADVYLKRKLESGGKKYVCLYEPHDNKDFEIVKTFLTACRGLGASGLGAGMYYMDEPSFLKHMTKFEVEKMISSKNKYTSLNGSIIKQLYDKYSIKYADKSEGKAIIDEAGIPIRNSYLPARNAFHVDIMSDVYSFFDSNKNKMIYALESLAIILENEAKTNKKLKEDAKKKLNKYKADVYAYKKYTNETEKSLPSKSRVWGETYSYRSADKWLLDITGTSTLSAAGFREVDKITVENFKNISKKQFELSHPTSIDSQGNVTSSKFVSVNDIKK